MAKARRFEELEQQRGKPMSEILREEYDKHGKQKAVAKSLGVSQPTVSQWLVRFNLQEKTVLVQRV